MSVAAALAGAVGGMAGAWAFGGFGSVVVASACRMGDVLFLVRVDMGVLWSFVVGVETGLGKGMRR